MQVCNQMGDCPLNIYVLLRCIPRMNLLVERIQKHLWQHSINHKHLERALAFRIIRPQTSIKIRAQISHIFFVFPKTPLPSSFRPHLPNAPILQMPYFVPSPQGVSSKTKKWELKYLGLWVGGGRGRGEIRGGGRGGEEVGEREDGGE